MATVNEQFLQATGEQRFRLSSVSWQTYETLLAEFSENLVRITYDRGELELMSPSNIHEWYARLFDRLVCHLTLELRIPIRGCRSTTLRRRDLQRGLEPDDCYYVQNESAVRGREINLERDPPPDLAIEVDVTNSSLDRMEIYAALGVPELWRYDGEELYVYHLGEAGAYELRNDSVAFPTLRPGDLLQFLDPRTELDETSLMLSFCDWVRAELAGDDS